ncbi:MAG: BON domain-containing protein [Betaproteobacteria bacterium]|nr:BON domain-containing protein [Betaproteobacteria bacterium]
MKNRLLCCLLIGGTVLPLLQGCFPAVVAGVAGGAMASLDRRSLATQAEDETIEWKAGARIGEKFGERVHVSFTSFNRKVLLTGEVPSAEIKAEVERLTSEVANVQGIYNELSVGAITSFSARSNDAYVTSKVKGRFVDIGNFNPVRVKVVTEAGVVFLMGLLTQKEADSAVWVTRTTAGVLKVVKVMEIISDAKARELDNDTSGKNDPASAKTPG